MVMVKVDTNTTLVNPLKNRTGTKMQRGYITFLNKIRVTFITKKFHILDNKCSKSMKTLIQQHCALKLVPLHFHQYNVAEVSFKAFKKKLLEHHCGSGNQFIHAPMGTPPNPD